LLHLVFANFSDSHSSPPTSLLVTLTLYTLMYVNRPWLLTLLCHLKCLLKTALHPPEIRLNRITPCYVTFLLPATSVVCAQHFVDRVVANFIVVIHNATSKIIICLLVFYRLPILHLEGKLFSQTV
jgi:hypothetical protein